jgi:hypothetical protein
MALIGAYFAARDCDSSLMLHGVHLSTCAANLGVSLRETQRKEIRLGKAQLGR